MNDHGDMEFLVKTVDPLGLYATCTYVSLRPPCSLNGSLRCPNVVYLELLVFETVLRHMFH